MPGFWPLSLKIRKQYSGRGEILQLARLLRISPADSVFSLLGAKPKGPQNDAPQNKGLGISDF